MKLELEGKGQTFQDSVFFFLFCNDIGTKEEVALKRYTFCSPGWALVS